jgi:hypothetical protein
MKYNLLILTENGDYSLSITASLKEPVIDSKSFYLHVHVCLYYGMRLRIAVDDWLSKSFMEIDTAMILDRALWSEEVEQPISPSKIMQFPRAIIIPNIEWQELPTYTPTQWDLRSLSEFLITARQQFKRESLGSLLEKP